MRPTRLEILLIVGIVVMTALFARERAIPDRSDLHLAAAEENLNLDVGNPSRWFSAWSVGDGQAFALIAADPRGRRLADHIRHEPGYRFARAGYGWSAAGLSLGQEPAIPYALALAGLLALIGVALLAIRLRYEFGFRAWLLLANPALYLGFGADTAETLGIFLLVGAMGFGWIWAVALLGVTRPTFLTAVLGNRWYLAAGIATAALLGLYSVISFGFDGVIPDGGRLGIPFAAYLEHPSVSALLLGGLALATGVVGLMKRDWAWVLTGLLVLSLGSDVTFNPTNAWRAAGALPVLWAFGVNYRVVSRTLRVPAGEALPA